MKLSKTEEQIMELIWSREKVFLKELLDTFPDPKPAPSTIATLLKRMQDKGYVGYTLFGNSREYFPLVKKEDYFSGHVRSLIRNYFGNSTLQFASLFTKPGIMTASELEDLKKIIEDEIKNREK